MTNLFEKFRSAINGSVSSPARPPQVIVCGVRQVQPQHFPSLPRFCYPSGRQETAAARPKPRPYWQERGWQRTGDVYEGYYQVNGQEYKGWAEKTDGVFDFYVIDPPRHRCFFHRGNGRFWVHPHGRKPRTVTSGIMSIEFEIKKALTG